MDDKELQDLLGDQEVPAPSSEIRLALLRQNLAMWQNSYFTAQANLRVAHEAGLTDLETRFFNEAKQMRVAFRSAAQEVDDLLDATQNGNQLQRAA